MWNWNIGKIICIFKWYIPLHFILNPGENTVPRGVFFFFLRPLLQLHTYKTCSLALKAEPLLQELSPHFQKSHIIESFFNMVAVSKHLGTASRARPLPTVGSGWSEEKKKKKRHLKLNLKMCFSWKPCRAAKNRGRHFHAPHFSWFLSEFPPFLPRSTLAPQLPTAALAADHDQQGIIGGASSTFMEPGQKCCPSSKGSPAWSWTAWPQGSLTSLQE